MRTMQAKQPALREHSSEVAQLAVAVARRFGMAGEEIDEVARAAELHDVGKVGIPDAILDKPGRARRRRVGVHAPAHDPRRAHPQRRAGAAPGRADRALHATSAGTAPATPTGCAATRSRRGARIVAVCDAYEAMTADRAYRARDRARGRLPGAARHGGHASSTRRSSTSSSTRSPSVTAARARRGQRRRAGADARRSRAQPARISEACAMPPISRGFHGRRRDDVDPARIPPGQYLTPDFPVLSAGPTPHTPLDEWSLTIHGAVDEPVSWSWDEFRALPAETFTVDIHCVTKWSKLDTTWTGVSVDTLLEDVDHRGRVPDRVVGRRLHDQPAAGGRQRRQGVGRLRLRRRAAATPSTAARRGCSCRTCTSGRARSGCAAWRSPRDDEPGFWEAAGYHNYGDPWREQRYWGD